MGFELRLDTGLDEEGDDAFYCFLPAMISAHAVRAGEELAPPVLDSALLCR